MLAGVGHISGSGAPITWRTSMGCWIGTPFRPGRRRRPGGDLDRAVERLDVDQPVAGEQLLRLRVRAVGDDRRALTPSDTTNFACSGPASPWASTSSPLSSSSSLSDVLEVDVGLDVLGRPLGHRRAVRLDLAVVLQQHESHRFILPDLAAAGGAVHSGVAPGAGFSTSSGKKSGPDASRPRLVRLSPGSRLHADHLGQRRERRPRNCTVSRAPAT